MSGAGEGAVSEVPVFESSLGAGVGPQVLGGVCSRCWGGFCVVQRIRGRPGSRKAQR